MRVPQDALKVYRHARPVNEKSQKITGKKWHEHAPVTVITKNPDIHIGCGGPQAARGVIDHSVSKKSSYVTCWLDLGNNASSGQFVLVQQLNGRNRRKTERLRTGSVFNPEFADAARG